MKHNLRFSMIYHFQTYKSNGFLSKLQMAGGQAVLWGSVWIPVHAESKTTTDQTPMCFKGNSSGWTTTRPLSPRGQDPLGNVNMTPYTFVPFNKNTVITGNPNEWFNPLMFDLQPTYYQGTTVSGVGPFPSIRCTTGNGGCYWGQLGNTGSRQSAGTWLWGMEFLTSSRTRLFAPWRGGKFGISRRSVQPAEPRKLCDAGSARFYRQSRRHHAVFGSAKPERWQDYCDHRYLASDSIRVEATFLTIKQERSNLQVAPGNVLPCCRTILDLAGNPIAATMRGPP